MCAQCVWPYGGKEWLRNFVGGGGLGRSFARELIFQQGEVAKGDPLFFPPLTLFQL